jgi:hypothetical protein
MMDPYAHNSVDERSTGRRAKLKVNQEAALNFEFPDHLDAELHCGRDTILNMQPNRKTTPYSPMYMIEGVRPFPFRHTQGELILVCDPRGADRVKLGVVVGHIVRTNSPQYRVYFRDVLANGTTLKHVLIRSAAGGFRDYHGEPPESWEFKRKSVALPAPAVDTSITLATPVADAAMGASPQL